MHNELSEKRLNTILYIPVYGLYVPLYGSNLSEYGKTRERIQAKTLKSNTMEEQAYIESPFKMQYYKVKNTLLHTAFSAILAPHPK